jgi:4-hydroxy-3-polyprenylbenzoate decarboxylase
MPYGVRLLGVLLRAGRTLHFTLGPAAVEVLEQGTHGRVRLDRYDAADLLGGAAPGGGRVKYIHCLDSRAGIACGSFGAAGMAICPCSMGTAAAVAQGLSQNLTRRAADVYLKERRRLAMVPRVTPLSVV